MNLTRFHLLVICVGILIWAPIRVIEAGTIYKDRYYQLNSPIYLPGNQHLPTNSTIYVTGVVKRQGVEYITFKLPTGGSFSVPRNYFDNGGATLLKNKPAPTQKNSPTIREQPRSAPTNRTPQKTTIYAGSTYYAQSNVDQNFPHGTAMVVQKGSVFDRQNNVERMIVKRLPDGTIFHVDRRYFDQGNIARNRPKASPTIPLDQPALPRQNLVPRTQTQTNPAPAPASPQNIIYANADYEVLANSGLNQYFPAGTHLLVEHGSIRRRDPKTGVENELMKARLAHTQKINGQEYLIVSSDLVTLDRRYFDDGHLKLSNRNPRVRFENVAQNRPAPQPTPQVAPQPAPQPTPNPTPSPNPQITHVKKMDPSAIRIHSLQSEAEFAACISGQRSFDLGSLYFSLSADCQGPLGTCVGYSSTNLLELAWWRYNYLNAITLGEENWNQHPVPFLSEVLFYRALETELRQNPAELSNRIASASLNRITEGAVPSTMLPHMLNLIKNYPETAPLIKETPENTQRAQAIGARIGQEAETLVNEAILQQNPQATPGTPAYNRIRYEWENFNRNPDQSLTQQVWSREERVHTSIENVNSNLQQKIANTISNGVDEMLEGSTPLKLPQDFRESLNSYTFYQRGQDKCDTKKMQKTFLYYLCQGIPVGVNGLRNHFPESHAIAVTGFMPAQNGREAVLLAKNSHRSNESVEIPMSSLCQEDGLTSSYLAYMKGIDDRSFDDGVKKSESTPDSSYYAVQRLFIDDNAQAQVDKKLPHQQRSATKSPR